MSPVKDFYGCFTRKSQQNGNDITSVVGNQTIGENLKAYQSTLSLFKRTPQDSEVRCKTAQALIDQAIETNALGLMDEALKITAKHVDTLKNDLQNKANRSLDTFSVAAIEFEIHDLQRLIKINSNLSATISGTSHKLNPNLN